MPDYSIVESLCKELNTTLAELINGEEDEKSIHTYDNEQIIDMIKEMQNLKNEKKMIIGYIFIVMGLVMLVLSKMMGGTNIQDFFAGFMLGLSIVEMVIGIYLLGRWIAYKNKNK